ncbi:MAG: precorrin-6y C5,15-methyltransferase (decarboxylating) subunit CbiE, partial [Thermodesulfobacteriota bacterium]
EQIVERCPCVVAAARYRELAAGQEKTVLPMAPLQEMLGAVAAQLEESDVAVLASGDPLFFGVGKKMLATFGAEALEIDPGVSSMQLAFARFKEPWDDAVFVSLHGRSGDNLARMLLAHRKVFVLTDRENSPSMVAETLLEHLRDSGQEQTADSYGVFVGENLGLAEERLVTGSLAEISGQSFADLNVMILKAELSRLPAQTKLMPSRWKRELEQGLVDFSIGLQEGEIVHSRGLITKDEVRAATLHRLRLPARGVFWDIGAGSGSISTEAARLCPQLDVFAAERNDQELGNIRVNIGRYGLHNIRLVDGEAPESLVGLPDPDRVFIGGSGGKLEEIIRYAAKKLADNGRIVVNGVIEQTRQLAPAVLHECGFEVIISEISVSRRVYPATDAGSHTFNTIAVIAGIK